MVAQATELAFIPSDAHARFPYDNINCVSQWLFDYDGHLQETVVSNF